MSEPKVTRRKLADYRPHKHNPNRHTERGLQIVEDSVNYNGAGRSGLAAADGTLLAGNGTWEAMERAGIREVIEVETDGHQWVIVKRADLTPDDARAKALMVSDNRSSEMGYDPDAELLGALLADIAAQDEHLLRGAGFTDSELQALLDGLQDTPATDAGAQVDRAAELAEQYGTSAGQLWQLGKHRLAIGDCTDRAVVDALMQGERADAVVTDPPYGQNQAGVSNDEPEKLKDIVCGAVKNIPCDNGVIIAFQSPRTFPEWLDVTRQNGMKFERMLWMYKAAQMTFPWRGWLLTSEAILVSSIGIGQWNDVHPYSHDCYYMSELSGELEEDSGWHGSVKPLHVVSDLMQRVSIRDSIIYDPFLGSGTTLIAAHQTGRTCYGCEIDPKYGAVIIQRWEALTGMKAERLADMGLTPARVE